MVQSVHSIVVLFFNQMSEPAYAQLNYFLGPKVNARANPPDSRWPEGWYIAIICNAKSKLNWTRIQEIQVGFPWKN